MYRRVEKIAASLLVISFFIFAGCESSYVRSARLYMQQQNPEKAIKILDEGAEKEPDNPKIWYELGVINGQQGNYEEMNRAFDKALSLDGSLDSSVKGERLQYWDTHYRNGANLGNEEKFEEALDEFKITRVIDDQKAGTYFGLGWINSKLGNHEEAIPHLERAVELDAEDLNSWHQLLNEYYVTEKNKKLVQASQKMIEKFPEDISGFDFMARAHSALGNDSLGIIYSEKVVEKNPEDGNLWFNLGGLYASAKKYPDAVRCYKKSVELLPEDYDAIYNLALVLKLDGKFDEALAVVEEMMQLRSDDPDSYRMQGNIYRSIAEKYESEGNIDKANEYKAKTAGCFKKAQELSKDES
ncbi:MAG: hypothetical protein B6244_11810 [Candidatus Cloacimonetes bacterium 4572_55]|nr:MAG: hypothetical protein B6244_11810 [Candidatus Cloacimonetes bacterium 4572_55]